MPVRRGGLSMPAVPGADDASQRRVLAAVQLLLLAVIVWLGAHVALYARNDLDSNGRWASAKLGLHKGVIGAVATMVTRPPLQRNSLNLGVYFGYQQLMLEHLREVAALELSFTATPGTYLDVMFGADPRDLHGVRLSHHPDFGSLAFRVGKEGGFLEARPLDPPVLRRGAWNRVRLDFDESVRLGTRGSRTSLELEIAVPPVRTVGFRGSQHGPRVDDVVVEFRDGSPPLYESFGNRRAEWCVVAILGLVGVALTAAGHRFLRVLGLGPARAHFTGIMAQAVVLFALGGYAALDYLHLSGLFPGGEAVDFRHYECRIETAPAAWERIRREIADLESDGRIRILLLGTSQTWGAGARRTHDVWARVLERELNRRHAREGPRVRVVNAGISGIQAAHVLEAYRTEWRHAEPDLVVVNLGNNDLGGPEFAAALRGIVELGRGRTQTVFMLEPNAAEGPAPSDLENTHRIMRRVAREHGVPVIDMPAYLWAQRESGFLWWDFVHLTSHGQRLLALRLADELEGLRAIPTRRRR